MSDKIIAMAKEAQKGNVGEAVGFMCSMTEHDLSRFRDLVLEEAAKACADIQTAYERYNAGHAALAAHGCTEAIRAMKEKK